MTQDSKQQHVIFTVCNLAYLPKALVLAESVFKYNHMKLKIFLFDRKIAFDFSDIEADLIWIEDLNIPDFYQLAFKYDIIELSTSLKPYISLSLLADFSKVIFLDPDTCLYSSVKPILRDLDNHSIVLTPHYTTPQTDDISESDVGMMRFGSFNLGFFGVRDSEEGRRFLQWWSNRCLQFSYMETQFGLSTDQKWVSIAPCFFQDLYVSFDLGYNAAPWNSFERKITKDTDGHYMVNQKFPLIFFHFSNFDPKDVQYLNKRSCYEKNMERPDLLDLGTAYNEALISKTTDVASTRYAFDYMSGGEYISPVLRRAYSSVLPELPANHDPFDSNGVVAKFARKNYLFERKNDKYKVEGFASLSANRNKLNFIYFFMRSILRLVGPNRFFNLSRLMVYLSSYRQNRELWKI